MMKNLLFLALLGTAQAAFRRIGTFHVCTQLSATCNTNVTTSAEIVTASPDGNTLIYTDSPNGKIGFVNITDPTQPTALGVIDVSPFEPTSVTVVKGFALAVINSSPNFTNPSGNAIVINITTRTVVRTFDLGGQPDSVAVSPDGNTVAIVIENERNEANSVNQGLPPQLPAGFVWLVDTSSTNISAWAPKLVTLTNLSNMEFPTDPEPEYVSINSAGMAVVTLQENNALVTINTTSGLVVGSFSAGAVNLTQVDFLEERNQILQVQSINNTKRQPDSVAWIDNIHFATADEGDIGSNGGRGFTIFDSRDGSVVYTSGNTMEWWTARIGHYPDDRSTNRGNEPEGILFAEFGGRKLLFVLSERASVVFVYNVATVTAPILEQILPASTPGPEGAVAIPSRNLLIVANEVDDRVNRIRSSISIYQDTGLSSTYPSLESVALAPDTPGPFIPFSALSGLAASPTLGATPRPDGTTTLYTVEDSFFLRNRIMTIEVTPAGAPYKITSAVRIKDLSNNLQAVLSTFANITIASRILAADKTVNIDPEGIAVSSTPGVVWIASEGNGAALNLPTLLPNLLLKVNVSDGNILQAVALPPSVNAIQTNNGFEGVAEYGNYAVVAFQREWVGEKLVRLGLFNTVTSTWKFVFYTLDAPTSQNTGGWVGLSDLAPLGNGRFLVLERDNQGGPDAAIKRVYEINLGTDLGALAENTTVTKTLRMDLMPRLATTWGNIPEKVEGLTVDARGTIWLNNDNDGVLNTNGEQQLNNLGPYVPLPPMAPPVTAPAAAPKAAVAPATAPKAAVAPVVVPVTLPTPVAPVPVVPPKATPVVAPVAAPVAAPTRKKCGLFKFSLVCLNGCGIIGRILKLCKN